MKNQNPNRISELRLAKRWNQRELADAIGVHYMTISKLERGEMKLTQEWMERLAPALNVSSAEILSDSSLKRMVYVDGHIGGDGFFYDSVSEKYSLGPVDFEIDLGVTPPDTTMWFFVKEPFFGPIAQEGSVARFSFIRSAKIDDFLGHVCLLEIGEGKKYIAGVVYRGREQGVYDLMLPNGARRQGIQPISFGVLSLFLPIPLFTPENYDGSHDWPNP